MNPAATPTPQPGLEPTPTGPTPPVEPGESPSDVIDNDTADLSVAGEEDPGSSIDMTDIAPVSPPHATPLKPAG